MNLFLWKPLKNRIKHSENPLISSLYRRYKEHQKLSKLHRSLRSFERGEVHFVNLENLAIWSGEWACGLPKAYDVIIGIPRSGLLVANILATKLGRPLSTPDLFIRNEYWQSKSMPTKESLQKALLVDDSITSGRTMQQARDLLESHLPHLAITTGVLISRKDRLNYTDLHFTIIPKPRLFEWNIMHKKSMQSVGFDMDGVLCEDIPQGIDADEPQYLQWLTTARSLYIPPYEIDYIVSNRLEKYRGQTEAWLRRNNVRYGRLIMWDLENKGQRRGRYAEHKIEVLKQIKPQMFFESSRSQSRAIWEATGIPTLCTTTMTLYGRFS